MNFKITKNFQGGQGIYYAILPKNKQVRKGCWEYVLNDWGEGTDGGHGYGYRITAKRTSKVPKESNILGFNANYLEDLTVKK